MVTALVVGPSVGALYPLIDTAVACRTPDSEACVWGKALLPLEVSLSAFVVGIPVAIATFLFLEWRRRSKGKTESS